VFEDADLDSVVEGVVDAIWFNQGQVCCAGSRILVQEGLADALIAKLRARMETLRVGDPLDKAVDIGAIIAPVQLERITRLVNQGRAEGATVWQPSWSLPRDGWFYPPTLCTDVTPAATIAQEEIFGPVVVLMTFRTPAEAVELANNTRYGLAASVWTENINLALDVAPKVKAGTIWINCTNVFDAAAGFGGYRESGFGREGGIEGLWEYVRRYGGTAVRRYEAPAGQEGGGAPERPSAVPPFRREGEGGGGGPPIDRTSKLYIGGKQVRPDGGYSLPIVASDGTRMGEVALGNRKDIRNAVEAAHAAASWGRATAHTRAQVLYYLAENLDARAGEIGARLEAMTGTRDGPREVAAAIGRLFTWAAWADKWDGRVHHTPYRNVTLAMPEPIGVIGIACPAAVPLLGFVSLVAPAIAMGNTVVAVPSEPHPLAATDFYQILDTSDVPGGVVNIVTGRRDELAEVLAAHDDVDAVWYAGSPGRSGGRAPIRRNPGRTWRISTGSATVDDTAAAGERFLQGHPDQEHWSPTGGPSPDGRRSWRGFRGGEQGRLVVDSTRLPSQGGIVRRGPQLLFTVLGAPGARPVAFRS
jgi:aldehyde dehydrogenase (NAD+)